MEAMMTDIDQLIEEASYEELQMLFYGLVQKNTFYPVTVIKI